MTGTRRRGLLLALCTAGVSAVSVYLNARAVKSFDDATVYTTAKNLVAAVLLAVLAGTAAWRRARSSDTPFRMTRPLSGPQWLGLGTVGVIGGSVPFVLFFEGLATASSPRAAFLQKTLVVWVALLAVLLLRERIGLLHVAAILLLILGQAGLAKVGAFPIDAGALEIMAATLLWSGEVVLAKRLLAGLSSWTLGVARMGLGSVVLVGWLAVTGRLPDLFSLDSSELRWLAVTGVLLTAYVATWFAALARAQAVDVTAVLVVGAVGTAVLAGVIDGVRLATQAGWLLAIVAGVGLVSWAMLRRPARRDPVGAPV
jgi:drug/metabolite transporter (DMT)-like permease